MASRRRSARRSGRNQIRVVVESLEQFVELLVPALALAITAALKRAPSEGGTPVDTGFARANWVPKIGERFQGLAGTRAEAELGQVSTAQQAEGEAELVSGIYDLARGVVHITNNVDYIRQLNAGSSAQAPAAFVQAAIADGIRRTVER